MRRLFKKRPKGDEQRVKELLYASQEHKRVHVKRVAEVLFPETKRSGTPEEGPDPTHGGKP